MDMGQMADMRMEMPAEPTDETSSQQAPEPLVGLDSDTAPTVAWDPLFEPCSHCLNHSRLPLGYTTLRETESAKRNTDTAAPRLVTQAALPVLPGLILDYPRDHAPPGVSSSRYLLINVFRI
jgi:hypothetical protein